MIESQRQSNTIVVTFDTPTDYVSSPRLRQNDQNISNTLPLPIFNVISHLPQVPSVQLNGVLRVYFAANTKNLVLNETVFKTSLRFKLQCLSVVCSIYIEILQLAHS